MRKQSRDKPLYRTTPFALGATFGVFICIALWLVSSKDFSKDTEAEIIKSIPSLGTLLIAMLSLYVSYRALREQARSREAGTDPVILVHLGQRPDAPTVATLEVSNVGAGAALEVSVKFEISRIERMLDDGEIITDFRETENPIRVIPQDRSVSYNFGVGNRLLASSDLTPIGIQVSYLDIDGNKYESNQTIDVRELRWQRADKPTIEKISGDISKIAAQLKTLASSNKEFLCVTQSLRDFRAEQKKHRAELVTLIEKHNADNTGSSSGEK